MLKLISCRWSSWAKATKCAMKVHQWFIKLIYFSSTRKLKIKGVKGAAYLPGDGSWNKHEETAGNSPDVGSGPSMPDLPPSSNAGPEIFDHQPSTSKPRNLASSHPTSSNTNTPFSPLNASPSHTNSNSSPPNLSSHDSTFDTGKVFFD